MEKLKSIVGLHFNRSTFDGTNNCERAVNMAKIVSVFKSNLKSDIFFFFG